MLIAERMKKKTLCLSLLALVAGTGAALWYFYPVLTFQGDYEGEFSDGSGKIKITISDKYYDHTFEDDEGTPLIVEFEYRVAPFKRLLLVDIGRLDTQTDKTEYYPVSLGYGEIDYHEIKGERLWLQKVNQSKPGEVVNASSAAGLSENRLDD